MAANPLVLLAIKNNAAGKVSVFECIKKVRNEFGGTFEDVRTMVLEHPDYIAQQPFTQKALREIMNFVRAARRHLTRLTRVELFYNRDAAFLVRLLYILVILCGGLWGASYTFGSSASKVEVSTTRVAAEAQKIQPCIAQWQNREACKRQYYDAAIYNLPPPEKE